MFGLESIEVAVLLLAYLAGGLTAGVTVMCCQLRAGLYKGRFRIRWRKPKWSTLDGETAAR